MISISMASMCLLGPLAYFFALSPVVHDLAYGDGAAAVEFRDCAFCFGHTQGWP